MACVKIEAPAKLNLHLSIGDKRPDGFHPVESLFLATAFGDTLRFETTPDPAVLDISMAPALIPAIPPEKNIVHKAVSLFKSRVGYAKGVKVTVTKRVPLGGGLGGGSSNAASALLAMNRLAAAEGLKPLSGETLAEMGASLGSDVPFFLCGSPVAWVSGRGDIVRPITLPDSVRSLHIVLVNPGFSSSTPGAFSRLDEYRHRIAIFERYPAAPPHDPEALLQSFAGPPRDWPFFNDFLPVFASGQSVYQQIISRLKDSGAEFAGLSGSGSTCFGIFSKQHRAESSKNTIFQYWPNAICTFPLANSIIDTVE